MLFLGSVYLYKTIGLSWWLFAGLLLVPDIFMLGYLANRTLGAYLYNVGHSYLAPALLLLVGYLQSSHQAMAVGIIWFAHIGMDRVAGYGLKYKSGFGDTHLGTLNPKTP